jgi:mRNA interferase RelE/StbE
MRKLNLTFRARKFLETLPPKQFRQIVSRVFGLLENPEPQDSRLLTGFPFRRIDVGEYRVIYRVAVDVVNVVLIGKRNDDEVYRDLERLH